MMHRDEWAEGMRSNNRPTGLRTNDISMDVRPVIIGVLKDDKGNVTESISLSQHYRRVNSDREVDRIQDAVRQLIDARKNSRGTDQIASRRESLEMAFAASLRWCGEQYLKREEMADAAEAVDGAITASIARRQLQRISNDGIV